MQSRSDALGVNWVGGRAITPTRIGKAAAASLAVAALLALMAHGAAIPPDCRSHPLLPAFGSDIETRITLRAGSACSVWALPPSATVDALQVIAAPGNGQLTSRGRTGVIYRPNAGFRGEDIFAFALQGRSQVEPERAIVRVRATVR